MSGKMNMRVLFDLEQKDQEVRRTGFDENFINAVKFHLQVICSILDKSNISRSQYDSCNLLMSKLFIDKIDMYPTKRFKCQVNEYSDWPLSLMPSEVFGEDKFSDEYRTNSFYKCLQVGDLLDCRVVSVLPEEYHLRVIHKYGATRILDDLNIVVVMPRTDSKLHVLEKELFPCELRVSVVQINREDAKNVFVTVSNSVGEVEKLGRLSEDHLPTYVFGDPPEHSSYSDYLKSLLGFRNPLLLNNILEGFGINPKGVYSFHPTFESLKPFDVNLLMKKMNLSKVKYYTNLALQEFENGNIHKALDSMEKAIELYPRKNLTKKDKIELSKLYEIRGEIRAKIENNKIVETILEDCRLAYETNPDNQFSKKHLSRALFLTSNKFYRAENYKKAAELVEIACKLDKNNHEALALLKYLKSQRPEVIKNLDEVSLRALQEKKRELVSKLKKIII